MSFRVDKSVWEEAATSSEEVRPPHEGTFDELDAEVHALVQLGAEGSGRYRRSAILGQGAAGSAAAVAGIPAAPSWESRGHRQAESGPIRLSDEILSAPQTGESNSFAEASGVPVQETSVAADSAVDTGESEARAFTQQDAGDGKPTSATPAEAVDARHEGVPGQSEPLEVDVVLPPLLATSHDAYTASSGQERLEIEVTTAAAVTVPISASASDEGRLVLPSLLSPSVAGAALSPTEHAEEGHPLAEPTASYERAFAIPSLVVSTPSGEGAAPDGVERAAETTYEGEGLRAGASPGTSAAHADAEPGLVAEARDGSPSVASSGPRRAVRAQRAVSRASGFIEVRDASEDGPPPAPASDAAFEDGTGPSRYEAADPRSAGIHDATSADARSWGEEASQTAREEPDADVEELDAEEAEIEDAELEDDEGAGGGRAHDDDPHAPEVALAAPVVAAVVADANPAPPPPPERGRRRAWHEEVFTEGHARLESSRDDDLVEREVEFVERQLGLQAGARVLDVGTGVGHFAIGLAKRGYAVTGVDSSLAVLLEASNRNEASGNVASFLHGDMRRLPDDESYDAVLCLGQTFGYFEEADNQLALDQMRLRLSVGGRLLLQVRSRDHMVARLPCRSWWQGPRCLVLDEGSFDPFTSRVHVHRTVIFEDGRQHEERSDVRVYAPHELCRMLGAIGMEVERLFGSRLTPEHYFPSVSPEIWIVARRTS